MARAWISRRLPGRRRTGGLAVPSRAARSTGMITGQVHLTSRRFCSRLLKPASSVFFFFFIYISSVHRPPFTDAQLVCTAAQLCNTAAASSTVLKQENWLCSGNDRAFISAWEHILWFPSLKVNLHSELSPQRLARDGLRVKNLWLIIF